MKEKRMADAEALRKEKGDNYNMKVCLFSSDFVYSGLERNLKMRYAL